MAPPTLYSPASAPGSSATSPAILHRCALPGCSKVFYRKEHLTRHLKSHDPRRQYECTVCRRRYARSDTLKRHLEGHSRDPGSRSSPAACSSCLQKQIQCDGNTPCQACMRDSVDCHQNRPLHVGRKDSEPTVNTQMNFVSDQISPMKDSELDVVDSILLSSQYEEPWITSIQEPWSLPPGGLIHSLSGKSSTQGFEQLDLAFDQSGQVGGITHTPVPEHASCIPPLAPHPQVESMPSSSSYSTGHFDRNPLSTSSHLPASSTAHPEGPIARLHNFLEEDFVDAKKLIQVYFSHIHPLWPILHAASFDSILPRNASPASRTLLGSMLALGSWTEGENGHVKLSPLVLDAVTALSVYTPTTLDENNIDQSLHTLQALLLSVVYCICCSTSEEMLAKAIQFNCILISNCRHLGIFTVGEAHHDLCPCPFGRWLNEEELHRLVFAVLRLDAYLSILTDHPPSVRYHEIRIPLPKSDKLWTAADEDERRKLQWIEPAGREKTLFHIFMRDILDSKRRRHFAQSFTNGDYHLGLSAMQTGIWEAVRESDSWESDELEVGRPSVNTAQEWYENLERLRKAMEYNSSNLDPDNKTFSSLNSILHHFSSMILIAPFSLLQGRKHDCSSQYDPLAQKPVPLDNGQVTLRAWISGPQSRLALRHAAQVARAMLAELEPPGHPSATNQSNSTLNLSRLRLNPLAGPTLLKAAFVAISYAFHTCACASCTTASYGTGEGTQSGASDGHVSSAIDLFNVSEDDVDLQAWMKGGAGWASWGGSSGIFVCWCRLTALATWFLEALRAVDGGGSGARGGKEDGEGDSRIERKFLKFLAGFGKGF